MERGLLILPLWLLLLLLWPHSPSLRHRQPFHKREGRGGEGKREAEGAHPPRHSRTQSGPRKSNGSLRLKWPKRYP